MGISGPPLTGVNITKYEARTARATNAEFEPSEESDVQVQLEVTTVAAKKVNIEIFVDGIRIANNEIPATVATQSEVPFCFIVPRGKKWKVNASTGIKEMFSNYLPLD